MICHALDCKNFNFSFLFKHTPYPDAEYICSNTRRRAGGGGKGKWYVRPSKGKGSLKGTGEKELNNHSFKGELLYFIEIVRKREDWAKPTNVNSAPFYLSCSRRNYCLVVLCHTETKKGKIGHFPLGLYVDLIARAVFIALHNFWNILAKKNFHLVWFDLIWFMQHHYPQSNVLLWHTATHPTRYFHDLLPLSTSEYALVWP